MDQIIDHPHALAEIGDDGHIDPRHRRYRHVCRCGKTGEWRPSVQMAKADHKMHAIVAETGGGA